MATQDADVSPELFTVLALAAGAGCAVTLFVAAHLSWVEKQRRRAWMLRRPEGASAERERGGFQAAAQGPRVAVDVPAERGQGCGYGHTG